MRNFSLLTKTAISWLNFSHVTRGAQGGPRRDSAGTLARVRTLRRRPPASTRHTGVQEQTRTPESNPGADPSAMTHDTHDVTSAVRRQS